MNMAFTAGCFFILQCIFLMDISVAEPLIDVSPSEVNLGITQKLDINCTFSLNKHPEMAALISLVLSRANATGQNFEELAAITQFTPTSVTLLTQEKVTATGVHSQTGESFLQLSWQYPTALQGGVYKCSALGVDLIGHNMEMTNISSVTIDEANLNDIFDILKQLQVHEVSMEQKILTLENDKLSMEKQIQNLENKTETLEDRTQTLENDKSSLEKYVTNLEHNISRLQVFVASITGTGPHEDFLGSHGNKDYYVSSYAFTDINNATTVCKSLGGQLAVIDNQDEFTAVQGFLTATSGISDVVIAGSDEQTEGSWVLPDTNTPLPFTSWISGYPRNDRGRNCLYMNQGSSWSMNDYYCHLDSPHDSFRFMCEV